MALHQTLSPIILLGIISLFFLLHPTSSASVSSRLQPSPSPMSTPYRNDNPIIYMTAFYDPKYHSISKNALPRDVEDNHRSSKSTQSTPTARTFTREEKAAILQKYQMLQNAKLFKRGIANSVDFTGAGDLLAVETRDSLALESEGTPARVVVKAKQTSVVPPTTQNKKTVKKDQIQAESGKQIKTSASSTQPNSAFNPHQSHNYYDNQSGGVQTQGALDELIHGRRKMRAHYFRQNRTPSLGKAFFEMKSRIGYW